MGYGFSPGPARLALALALTVAAQCSPAHAASIKGRITGLSDVAFGQITTASDVSISQTICVYSSTGSYYVTASSAEGSFALTSGAGNLTYRVEWSGTAGQSSGTSLLYNQMSGPFTSIASQQTCNSGPASSASLIVTIPATASSVATAGSYSGTLTLMIEPN